MKVTFVTGNPGKLVSANEHLAPLGIEIEQVDLTLDEIQSVDVQEIAMHKARQAFRILRSPLFIEDSGFGLDELGGYPGPMVKYLLAAAGATGVAHLVGLTTSRHGRFAACLAYIDAHGVPNFGGA